VTLMDVDLTVDSLSSYIRQWCRKDSCRPGSTFVPRGSEVPSKVESINIFCRLFRTGFHSDDRSWFLAWDLARSSSAIKCSSYCHLRASSQPVNFTTDIR